MNWNPREVFFKRSSSIVSNNNKLNRSSIWEEAQMRIHSNPINKMTLCSDHMPVYSLLHRSVMVCWTPTVGQRLSKDLHKLQCWWNQFIRCTKAQIKIRTQTWVQKTQPLTTNLNSDSECTSKRVHTKKWCQICNKCHNLNALMSLFYISDRTLDMISNNVNCNSRLLRAWRTPTRCMLLIVLTLKDECTLDALPKSGITKMFSKGEYKEYSTLY